MFGWLRKAKSASVEASEELFDEKFQRKLEVLAIVSRKLYAGRTRAERRSKKTGSGIEFADHRQYTPGDDFRFLDWNVYQRFGKLLVRLYEEEEDLSVYIIVDTSKSMGFGKPKKLNYAKQLAAALAYVALANLDRVSILTFDEAMGERLAPTRGKNRIFKVFNFLRSAEVTGKTDMQAALKTFVAQNKRRGLAILISDLYDPAGFEAGINTLRYAKFEPYVLQIFDPTEVRPPLHGDVRLVDRETGQSRDITITPRILERYEKAHQKYRHRIEQFCSDKQVAWFPMSTEVAFDEAILHFLRRGGMVK